ncbi:MAG TPA: hypothetical protein VJ965_12375 [Anaerolineales bacterium]|nr:hypothetical protein [Anaerolineales bacterium]
MKKKTNRVYVRLNDQELLMLDRLVQIFKNDSREVKGRSSALRYMIEQFDKAFFESVIEKGGDFAKY